MFTINDLNELAAARQKRQQLDLFIQERLALWNKLTNAAGYIPTERDGSGITVTIPAEILFNRDEPNITVEYNWYDSYAPGPAYRKFTVPKKFVFDITGEMEQRLHLIRELATDLGTNVTIQ